MAASGGFRTIRGEFMATGGGVVVAGGDFRTIEEEMRKWGGNGSR
jgi:hypothetical protein